MEKNNKKYHDTVKGTVKINQSSARKALGSNELKSSEISMSFSVFRNFSVFTQRVKSKRLEW